MAITANDSPFILTAQGDDLRSVFQGKDGVDTDPVCTFACTQIRIFFGASGVCTLMDKPTAEGGQILFRGQAANPGDIAETQFATAQFFNGCYVESLPANSEVYLYVE